MSDRPPNTILFVDDNLSGTLPLRMALRRAGFIVHEAATGEQAMALMAERPHLVILDIHLPDISGFEVCRRIKSNPLTASTLVLHLTGLFVQPEDRATALEGGADGYLIKPVDPLELIAHVKALLRLRKAEVDLHASEVLLQHILENAPVIVHIKDVDGRYILVNKRWETLFLRGRTQIVGRTPYDVFPRPCADVLRDNDLRVLAARQPIEFEETVPLDGEPHTYLSVKFPLFDESGEPYAVCCMSTEITERKQAEEALRQAELRYRSIFENAVEGIFQTTPEGHFLTANPALARMLGFESSAQLLGEVHDIAQQLHVTPDRRGEFMRRLQEKGLVYGFECELYRRDRSRLWVSLSGRAVRGPEGGILYLQGIVEDISERKRAEQALQFRVHQQAVIADLGRLALASTNLDAFLSDGAAVVAHTLQVGVCRVLQLLPDGKTFQLRAGFGFADELLGQAQPVSATESLAGYTLRMREPILATHLATETRFRVPAWYDEQDIVSAMCTVLPGPGERPWGVLTAESRQPRSFIHDDVHFLQAVASVLATAIQRKQAEAKLLASQAEMVLARRIQQKLFPTVLPQLPGLDIGSQTFGFDVGGASYPAEAIGGDYFDYLTLADGCLGVTIGDVSGHGVGPALLMAELRALLRAFAQTEPDVGTILGRANHLLTPDIDDDRFITLLLGRLDPVHFTFRYASAGHTTGYVLDAAGNVRHTLPSTAMPLGIFPDTEFPSSDDIHLHTGDLIVFVTDGVVEARSAEGLVFGTARTIDTVRAHRHEPARTVVERLYEEVRAFCEDQPQYDDITATVIKVVR